MRTESYGQKKFCGQMKQLSWKRKELSEKMEALQEDKNTLKECEMLIWKEAFGPEREAVSRDATVHRGRR